MLRFCVYSDGQRAAGVDLSSAHLVGPDGVGVRAEIAFKDGEIVCRKMYPGPAGLALLWPVQGAGRILLQTTRLPERDRPYVLDVELARGMLMRLSQRQEDWELDDPECHETLSDQVSQSRDLLIEALQADDEAAAAELAARSLSLAVQAGEDLSLKHAGTALVKRREGNGFGKRLFGCMIDVNNPAETHDGLLPGTFDFVTVPLCWRQLEPREQQFDWKPADAWVEWLSKKSVVMKGSGLVDFTEKSVPDWLYIWEHDFETIRDLLYEHIRRVINRYGQYIQAWDVVTGLHATNSMSFNTGQLMELTRMAAAVARQLAPRATTIIDLIAPWGEYYARNQRTIPPMMYADMVMQSGIQFDAFGLQFYFGLGRDDMYVRDMFQISSLLDRFGNRGKRLHITAVQVPSGMAADQDDAWGGEVSIGNGGAWRSDWTEEVQSEWVRSFYEIALSKPFVDTVTWRDLGDHSKHYLPHGGLLRGDLSPKPAYEQLAALRQGIQTTH